MTWTFARQPWQIAEAGKDEQRLLQVETMKLALREGKQAKQYTAEVAWLTFLKALLEKGHEGEGAAAWRWNSTMRHDVNNSND